MAATAGYRTIKALVFDFVHRCGGKVDYDALTQEVRKHFPDSRWKRTHWAWYRNQILHGRFKGQFSEAERAALSLRGRRKPGGDTCVPPAAPEAHKETDATARGPRAKDPEIKQLGDALLNHVRLVISLAAGEDLNKRFKLNRWVFSRLLQDEIRVKRPIKQRLWDGGMRTCQSCNEPFASPKGVELHRKNESQGYTADNCELLCRDCHQELG